MSPRSPPRSGETHVDSSPEELCGPVELSLTGQVGGTVLGADRPRDADSVGGPRSGLLLRVREGRVCDVARVPAVRAPSRHQGKRKTTGVKLPVKVPLVSGAFLASLLADKPAIYFCTYFVQNTKRNQKDERQSQTL